MSWLKCFCFSSNDAHLFPSIFIDSIPTDLEQATGAERKELEAILGGNPVSYVYVLLRKRTFD